MQCKVEDQKLVGARFSLVCVCVCGKIVVSYTTERAVGYYFTFIAHLGTLDGDHMVPVKVSLSMS